MNMNTIEEVMAECDQICDDCSHKDCPNRLDSRDWDKLENDLLNARRK